MVSRSLVCRSLATVTLATTALALGCAAQESTPAPTRHRTTLVRVIDGDTIHVLRDGRVEKLRLLGVDTEEVRDGGPGSKPVTSLGRAASAHVKELLRCNESGEPRSDAPAAVIELEFEGGREERDTYGRLLCFAWFEGVDLNVHLVETGFSPYFTKYGYAHARDERLRDAQSRAQQARKGIWGERPAGDAARDYAPLLRWWNARADALRAAEDALREGRYLDARDAAVLRQRAAAGGEHAVFGAAFAVHALRDRIEIELEATTAMPVVIECRASELAPELIARLLAHAREGAPNFLSARGRLVVGEKGARLECSSLGAIALETATSR